MNLFDSWMHPSRTDAWSILLICGAIPPGMKKSLVWLKAAVHLVLAQVEIDF